MMARRSYARSRSTARSREISPETLALSLVSCLEEWPQLRPALAVSLLLFAAREAGRRISWSHCGSCTECSLAICRLWLADNALSPS